MDTIILSDPLIVVKSGVRSELARDCLKWHLYTPGGFMRNEYIAMCDGVKTKTRRRLLVLYVKDVPACAIVGCKNYIMVYTCPIFRRSGYGTFMINHYIRKYRLKRSELRALGGIRGSGQLYWSCGIQLCRNAIDFYEAFDWRTAIHKRI